MTRDEAAATRRAAADRRLTGLIDDSSDEESEAASQARVAEGLDGEFGIRLPHLPFAAPPAATGALRDCVCVYARCYGCMAAHI